MTSWYDYVVEREDWLGQPEPRRNDELQAWLRAGNSIRDFPTRYRAENIQDGAWGLVG